MKIRVAAGQAQEAFRSASQSLLQQFEIDDLDRNQSLDVAEAKKSPLSDSFQALLVVADRNNDGKLAVPELQQYLDMQAIAAGQHVVLGIADHGVPLFEMLDANDDGTLTLRLNAWQRVSLFSARLGSDQLAWNDLPRRHEWAFSIGASKSNQIHRPSEQAERVSPPGWFSKMDSNHDGDLSRREFPSPPASFNDSTKTPTGSFLRKNHCRVFRSSRHAPHAVRSRSNVVEIASERVCGMESLSVVSYGMRSIPATFRLAQNITTRLRIIPRIEPPLRNRRRDNRWIANLAPCQFAILATIGVQQDQISVSVVEHQYFAVSQTDHVQLIEANLGLLPSLFACLEIETREGDIGLRHECGIKDVEGIVHRERLSKVTSHRRVARDFDRHELASFDREFDSHGAGEHRACYYNVSCDGRRGQGPYRPIRQRKLPIKCCHLSCRRRSSPASKCKPGAAPRPALRPAAKTKSA